jgi:RHS repeat-associated protein
LDALGNTTAINATTKNINYSYLASGKVQAITNVSDNSQTTMTYDTLMLTPLSITDPDAGIIKYRYNGFNQIISQTDALNQRDTMVYDAYGRVTSKTSKDKSGNTNVTSFVYSTSAGTLGLVHSISRGNVTETYSYDPLCRVNTVTTSGPVTPGGAETNFITACAYNTAGQLSSVTYPSGLAVNYVYDGAGNLSQINNATGGNIWTGKTVNALNQWTQFSLGNGLVTNEGYDSNYRLNSIQTGLPTNPTGIQNLSFTSNPAGQLTQRKDEIFSLTEGFKYDPVNRLTNDSLLGASTNVHVTSYLDDGNINSTKWGGAYGYDPSHPHAVLSVTGVDSTNTTTPPSINTSYTYNTDHEILSIDNVTYHDDFTYGVGANRFRVDMKASGNLILSKVYVNNSEFGYNSTGTLVYKRTIIKAPTGVCAVYQDSGNVKALYYIHTDNLGSWLAITDNAGSLKSSYSYDAWGRPRNPSTWLLQPISSTNALVNLNSLQPRFDRGYTGHELMAGFGLINMNGRLYDPYLQRFLNPDPIIQDPDDGQSYNRYSYCLNNPLMYIDPTGYEGVNPHAHQQYHDGGGPLNSVGIETDGNGCNYLINSNYTPYSSPGWNGDWSTVRYIGNNTYQDLTTGEILSWEDVSIALKNAGLLTVLNFSNGCSSLEGSNNNNTIIEAANPNNNPIGGYVVPTIIVLGPVNIL